MNVSNGVTYSLVLSFALCTISVSLTSFFVSLARLSSVASKLSPFTDDPFSKLIGLRQMDFRLLTRPLVYSLLTFLTLNDSHHYSKDKPKFHDERCLLPCLPKTA